MYGRFTFDPTYNLSAASTLERMLNFELNMYDWNINKYTELKQDEHYVMHIIEVILFRYFSKRIHVYLKSLVGWLWFNVTFSDILAI